MIAYLDSSVLLRHLLRQKNALEAWKTVRRGVVSALAEVECLRTIDRLRVAAELDAEEVAALRETIYAWLGSMDVIAADRPVLSRASQPLPVILGSLDAIHLASAQLWQEQNEEALVMATHDRALGLAARSVGLRVIGL